MILLDLVVGLTWAAIYSLVEEVYISKGDKHGECDGFEVEFSVESEEPLETIQQMLDLAHKMCFTETALSQPVAIAFTHKLNRQVI